MRGLALPENFTEPSVIYNILAMIHRNYSHQTGIKHPNLSQTLQTLSNTRPLDIGKLIDTPPVGLPHQEGYIHRADRKDDTAAIQRSQGQRQGHHQGHQQGLRQQQQGRREGVDDDPFGVHNGRLAPRHGFNKSSPSYLMSVFFI